MRTSMVRHSFEKLYGVKTNLLCFSDDLDGLRKVPDNIPNRDLIEKELHKNCAYSGIEHLEKYLENAKVNQYLDKETITTNVLQIELIK